MTCIFCHTFKPDYEIFSSPMGATHFGCLIDAFIKQHLEVDASRAALAERDAKIAEQAEVIEALERNLDTIRTAIRDVTQTYCSCFMCRKLRAALEGVEAEETKAEGETQ